MVGLHRRDVNRIFIPYLLWCHAGHQWSPVARSIHCANDRRIHLAREPSGEHVLLALRELTPIPTRNFNCLLSFQILTSMI
jgi:hypothetical protein